MRKVTHLTDFPIELLERIFSYLPDQDTRDIGWLIVSHVCRLWRDIALNQATRPLRMRLLPDRAQRDIQTHVDELYSPLPINLIIEEYRLDMTRAPVHERQWVHTVYFINLISSRVRTLYVKLRQHIGRLHRERIEELLPLALSESTLEGLTISLETSLETRPPRTLSLPFTPRELLGGGLRAIHLHKCRLQEQSKFFSTQPFLQELSATVVGPLSLFFSEMPTRYLTLLNLALTVQSDPLQTNEDHKYMPALRDLTIKSTMQDALTFVQAVQLPSLVALTLDFSAARESDVRAVGIEPLVEWLSISFGRSTGTAAANLSVDHHILQPSVSWSGSSGGLIPRKLNIVFPRLSFARNRPFATQRAEEYGAFITAMSEMFSVVDDMRLCVNILPSPIIPLSLNLRALLNAAVLHYFEELPGVKSLHLDAITAQTLLPLRNGTLPRLSELQIDTKIADGEFFEVEERQELLGSLRALALGEADARQGKCQILVGGVEIRLGEQDESEDDDAGSVERELNTLRLRA